MRTEALSGMFFRAGAKAIRYNVNITLISLVFKGTMSGNLWAVPAVQVLGRAKKM